MTNWTPVWAIWLCVCIGQLLVAAWIGNWISTLLFAFCCAVCTKQLNLFKRKSKCPKKT